MRFFSFRQKRQLNVNKTRVQMADINLRNITRLERPAAAPVTNEYSFWNLIIVSTNVHSVNAKRLIQKLFSKNLLLLVSSPLLPSGMSFIRFLLVA